MGRRGVLWVLWGCSLASLVSRLSQCSSAASKVRVTRASASGDKMGSNNHQPAWCHSMQNILFWRDRFIGKSVFVWRNLLNRLFVLVANMHRKQSSHFSTSESRQCTFWIREAARMNGRVYFEYVTRNILTFHPSGIEYKIYNTTIASSRQTV